MRSQNTIFEKLNPLTDEEVFSRESYMSARLENRANYRSIVLPQNPYTGSHLLFGDGGWEAMGSKISRDVGAHLSAGDRAFVKITGHGIVGYLDIAAIMKGSPDEVWEGAQHVTSFSYTKDKFDEMYAKARRGNEVIVVFKAGNRRLFPMPIDQTEFGYGVHSIMSARLANNGSSSDQLKLADNKLIYLGELNDAILAEAASGTLQTQQTIDRLVAPWEPAKQLVSALNGRNQQLANPLMDASLREQGTLCRLGIIQKRNGEYVIESR